MTRAMKRSMDVLEAMKALEMRYHVEEAYKGTETVIAREGRIPFREFIEPAWVVNEPMTPFVGGYHVDAIAEHLEAVSDGQIQNLIINIPPRHTKSTFVCVLWPSWEWTFAPHLQYLFASYREPLALRDSVKMRRLITSSWYRGRWGGMYQLQGDQNQKGRFENDRSGYRLAISVGTGTGEGGDRLVLDDPMSADQAESDAERDAANEWCDATFSTRANNPATAARVIVQQRLHEVDTTGHLLKKMAQGGRQFDHLVLPAEYEPRAQVCVADLMHDPRSTEGEPLSPARFDTAALEELKIDLGNDDRVAGQLQQRPSRPGGVIYRREWWADRNRFSWLAPAYELGVVGRFMSVDTAYKDKRESDYTAVVIADLLADYRLGVREIRMDKVQFPDLLDFIESMANEWNWDGKLRAVVVEEKGSGISALQQLRSSAGPDWLAEMLVGFEPGGSKEYRARKSAVWCRRSMVLLPEPSLNAPWMAQFAGPEPLGNLFKFPSVEHDDDVDAFTQLIDYCWELLAGGWRAMGSPKPEDDTTPANIFEGAAA